MWQVRSPRWWCARRAPAPTAGARRRRWMWSLATICARGGRRSAWPNRWAACRAWWCATGRILRRICSCPSAATAAAPALACAGSSCTWTASPRARPTARARPATFPSARPTAWRWCVGRSRRCTAPRPEACYRCTPKTGAGRASGAPASAPAATGCGACPPLRWAAPRRPTSRAGRTRCRWAASPPTAHARKARPRRARPTSSCRAKTPTAASLCCSTSTTAARRTRRA